MIGTTPGSFHVLTSRLEDEAIPLDSLGERVRHHAERLSDAERADLLELVYPDVFSEYDARFLDEELRSGKVAASEAFWACEGAWARDERLHYEGFRSVYSVLAGRAEAELEREMEARREGVSFEPIAHLLDDELSIACLLAYDELATVRAYRAGRSRYARLGAAMVEFVRAVTADEGRHFRNFLKLVRTEHAGRIAEVPRIVERIRATEGTPYANTFVLDHDDAVWNDAMFDESAELLLRHLGTPE